MFIPRKREIRDRGVVCKVRTMPEITPDGNACGRYCALDRCLLTVRVEHLVEKNTLWRPLSFPCSPPAAALTGYRAVLLPGFANARRQPKSQPFRSERDMVTPSRPTRPNHSAERYNLACYSALILRVRCWHRAFCRPVCLA
jgi:hypothetical protein